MYKYKYTLKKISNKKFLFEKNYNFWKPAQKKNQQNFIRLNE